MNKMMKNLPWLKCPLVIDFEIGTSWGGGLKTEILEQGDDMAKFQIQGLKRDIEDFKTDAGKGYSIDNFEIKDVISEGDEKFPVFTEDEFIQDTEFWKCEIGLSKK